MYIEHNKNIKLQYYKLKLILNLKVEFLFC